MKLSEVRLNTTFVTEGIDKSLELGLLSIYPKMYCKKDDLATKLNNIYARLGFNKIFQCDENLTLMNMLVFMVNNGYPLSEEEIEIFNSYDEVVKSSANRKPILTPVRMEYNGINMTENYAKKIPQIGKLLLKRFKLLGHLDKFYNGEIDGNKLTEHMINFIQSQVTVVQHDTNVLVRVPRNYFSNKNKIRVYLPSTIDLKNTTEVDVILSIMVNELNYPSYGVLSSQVCNQIIQVLKTYGNLYTFSDNIECINLIFNLEMLRRYYLCSSIKELLEPNFTLGTPIDVQLDKNSFVVIGNYDETITICGKTIFNIDKENYRRVCTILQSNAMTGAKKPTVEINGEKKAIWDLLFPNTLPKDGNYNNIVRTNVK